MNNNNPNAFTTDDVAPNPFLNGPDQPQIPVMPGFDVAATRKSPINMHGVLTLAIVAIAGAAIWGMRSIGLRGQAIAGDSATMLDYKLNGAAAAMSADDARIIADLNASRVKAQVTPDGLAKNPFALSAATRPRPKANSAAALPSEATPEQIAQARQQNLIESLSLFKLQGVMGGAAGVARINGKPFRVNDTFGDKGGPTFTVTHIDGREVTVTADGFTFIMSMDVQ